MTRAYIPDDVITAITGSSFALNLHGLISFKNSNAFGSLIDDFSFDLSNSLFNLVGLKSDSIVYNTYSFFTILILTIPFHLWLFVFNKLVLRCRSEGGWSWWIKTVKWISNKYLETMTFGYYIRAVLQINQFLLIASIYEIYLFQTSKSLRIVSLVFSFLILFACILLIVFSTFLALKTLNRNENGHSSLNEFFNGVKLMKKFKIYTTALLLRRMIFILLLITLLSVPSKILIALLAIIQIFYSIFISFQRPFSEIKWNIVILNWK